MNLNTESEPDEPDALAVAHILNSADNEMAQRIINLMKRKNPDKATTIGTLLLVLSNSLGHEIIISNEDDASRGLAVQKEVSTVAYAFTEGLLTIIGTLTAAMEKQNAS